MIRNYFISLKASLILSPVIESYQVIRELITDLEGYLRIQAFLVDKGQLNIFIYVTSNKNVTIKKYSFHWQDEDKNLVIRWDNAPHHRELKNFPHHLHLKGEIKPSIEPNFSDVLAEIEKKLMDQP